MDFGFCCSFPHLARNVIQGNVRGLMQHNVFLLEEDGLPKTQGLSLVVATAVACVDVKTSDVCFDADIALCWTLLTSLPIETAEDVQCVVRFYALRWRIERLHFTLKSGALDVETLQFDDVHTLVNALSFYSVVAWRLLGLTYALRQDPEQPAENMFDADELKLLHQLSGKPVDSLRQATLALTHLVGFAPSKKQPLLGVKVLATAIERFFLAKQGAKEQGFIKVSNFRQRCVTLSLTHPTPWINY